MLVSIAAGLLIGCSNMPNNFLSIPRVLVFYPFFLAGMNFDRALVSKLRTPVKKTIAAISFAAFTAFLALAPEMCIRDSRNLHSLQTPQSVLSLSRFLLLLSPPLLLRARWTRFL